MILTVTPNPSVDRTIEVSRLLRGEVHRALSTRTDPGGKGINVSRAVAAGGGETLAIFPAGGPHGVELTGLLAQSGVPVRTVAVSGATRSNVAVTEPDGTTTKVNEPGPVLSGEEVAALLRAVAAGMESVDRPWVVGCGSLPGGAPTDLHAQVVRLAHDHGCRAVVDTSGPPLAAAVEAGPDLLTPNRAELGELVDADLPTVGHVVDAAHDVLARGVGCVLVTAGRDGALLVTPERVALATADVARPLSSVGAGDCALAGLLLALDGPDEDSDPFDALRRAVATGSAAVVLPGTQVPSVSDVSRIHVRLDPNPDRSIPLTD